MKGFLLCAALFVLALSAQDLASTLPKPLKRDLRADFIAEPRFGEAPLTVQFTNLSQPGKHPIRESLWDFGDSLLIIKSSPSHEYLEPGVYSVALIVTDAADSSASVVFEECIRVYDTPPKGLTKAALAIYPTTGLSLGFEMFPKYDKRVRTFLNLDLMSFFLFVNSIGANVEFRGHPVRGSGFYLSVFLGGEMVWVIDLDFTWGKNMMSDQTAENDEKSYFPPVLIPHVALGLGYQWEYGDRNWFFVDLKTGAMNFLGTLRAGIIF
ncbi:MAG: PKD domain-containing protein [Candidatus Syntrophosphaera sp.]